MTLDELIEHMGQSAEGQRSLGDGELRLIQSNAGRIAQEMTGRGMPWEEVNRIWDHVIDIADRRHV